MSIKKFFWKIWLRLNMLTRGVENDYVAEVSTIGKSLYNKDIAQAIKDEGAEWQVETLLDILNRADRIRRQRILEGYTVITGLCRVSPRVPGVWKSANANFDPKVNKPTCDLTVSSELYKALEEVGVEVLGVKDSGAFIGQVTDAATGRTDGVITSGDDVVIEGNRIKVSPEDEEWMGVFFIAEDGSEHQVTRRLTQNTPKKVIARVPDLGTGTYTLKIVTRHTHGSLSLKEPRTIVYPFPLVIE